MKIKNKTISIFLSLITVFSISLPVFAANPSSASTSVKYEGTGTETYEVTVPSLLAPGGSGNVTLSGTWSNIRRVKVSTPETVILINNKKATDTKTLKVTFEGINKAGNNTAAVSNTKIISLSYIENALFGTWEGNIIFDISVESERLINIKLNDTESKIIAIQNERTWQEALENTNVATKENYRIEGYDLQDFEYYYNPTEISTMAILDDDYYVGYRVDKETNKYAYVQQNIDGDYIKVKASDLIEDTEYVILEGEENTFTLNILRAGLYDYETNEFLKDWDTLIEEGMIEIVDKGDGTFYFYPPKRTEFPAETLVVKYGCSEMGTRNFWNTSTKKVILPSSVKKIGYCAFWQCRLEEIVLPEGLEEISECGIHSSQIKNIYIPSTVKYIDDNGIFYNSNLTGIDVSPNNKYYSSEDGILYNKEKTVLEAFPITKTGTFEIPYGVEEIGGMAFGTTQLTTIIIPDSVKYIREGAINGASGTVKEIYLPKSVVEIGDNNFYDYYSSPTIYYEGTEEDWNNIKKGNSLLTFLEQSNTTIIFNQKR